MSREIKFRFWDTKEGKWLGKDSSYWKELTFEDCQNKLIASLRQGNIMAEQYTGSKDQYAKEIYEGDIIRIAEEVGGYVMQDGSGEWIIIGDNKKTACEGRTLGELKKLHKWSLGMTLAKEYCSIVGNIHENLELLEEIKDD